MPTIITGTMTRCSGNNHYELPCTVNGQATILRFTKEEIEEELSEPPRERFLGRLASAIKEANATTWTQARTAVSGKTFKV